jgi:hypothetical protein
MKTKITFLLSAIIVVTGLVITCQLEEIEEEKVTVTFDSNGGSPVKPVTLGRGGSLGGSYTIPSRDEANFTFSGWYDGFTEYTGKTGIYADITLTAKWAEIVEYASVSFNSNGGTPIGSIAVVKGGVLGSQFPAAPRKKGYAFDQWLINGVKLTKDTVIANNSTAIAQWEEVALTYTVSFDSNGAITVPEPIVVFAGDCINEWEARFPPDPEHSDQFAFLKGWYDEQSVPYTGRTPITKNVDLTAEWGIRVPKETIELDLSDFTTEHFNIAGAEQAEFADGTLTVTFTAENQGISIVNPDRLRELLAIANSVTVEIDGSVNYEDRLFRVLIGNPHKLGREWNATKSHDNVPFAELNRVLEIEEDNRRHDGDATVWGDDNNPPNTPDMHRINFLFIQARGTNPAHTPADPTVVTLRSVKITIE